MPNPKNYATHWWHNSIYVWLFLFLKKWAIHSFSFLYFRLFNTQLTVNKCSMNIYIFGDDWIRTANFWYWKRPLYQLSHNHCPIYVWLLGRSSCSSPKEIHGLRLSRNLYFAIPSTVKRSVKLWSYLLGCTQSLRGSILASGLEQFFSSIALLWSWHNALIFIISNVNVFSMLLLPHNNFTVVLLF